MITLSPARARPADRAPSDSDKTPEAQLKTWIVGPEGWVTNANLVAQGGAPILENFLSYSDGWRPRGGYEVQATTTGDVVSLFAYLANGVKKFFAADDTSIYEFSTGSSGALTASVTGQTSGAYSALESQTAGGSFLTVVNGEDAAQQFNGSTWSAPSITGVSSADLSHIWAYGNRNWFVEKDTLSAWYLGTNSVSGAATEFPLSSVFNSGGSLLFGANWSSDAGDGLDDRCVFVTDRGEAAVYAGDPAGTFALQGVFEIGAPLSANAYFRLGGDLIIATSDGLIPMSGAVGADKGQLPNVALSRAIEPNWRKRADSAGNWSIARWNAGGFAYIATPKDADGADVFAFNLKTGAWSLITGWLPSVIAGLSDEIYFGDGVNICRANRGGTDDGSQFVCKAAFAADHMEAPGRFKTVQMARATFKYNAPYSAKVSVAADHSTAFPPAPSTGAMGAGADSLWDVAAWDAAEWGKRSDDYLIDASWRTVSAQGWTAAPQVQVLSSSAASQANVTVLSVDALYSVGGPVV